MTQQNRRQAGLTLMALAVLMSLPVVGANHPPDLTKGETNGVDREQTYNLGPTGLRGWIYTKPAAYLDSVQGRTTTASRQILVTHVGTNSPASGVMEVNDVILGAGGSPFTDDARKSIAKAIQEAEMATNRGTLKLTRWRAGDTREVQLKLRVMGTYSDTAPTKLPAGRLEITLNPSQQVKTFELNLATAEGWAHFTDSSKLEAFFSAASPVAALRIPGPEPKNISLIPAGAAKEAGDAGPSSGGAVSRLGYPPARPGQQGRAQWYVQEA